MEIGSRGQAWHEAGRREAARITWKFSWSRWVTSAAFLLVLLVAAILESGGDAIVRIGLHSHSSVTRLGLCSAPPFCSPMDSQRTALGFWKAAGGLRHSVLPCGTGDQLVWLRPPANASDYHRGHIDNRGRTDDYLLGWIEEMSIPTWQAPLVRRSQLGIRPGSPHSPKNSHLALRNRS